MDGHMYEQHLRMLAFRFGRNRSAYVHVKDPASVLSKEREGLNYDEMVWEDSFSKLEVANPGQ